MFYPFWSICDGVLMKRDSLFKKQKMLMSSVAKIVAVSREALTHDEVLIAFISETGKQLIVSEFDEGFGQVMDVIYEHLNDMRPWRDIEMGSPLEFRSLTLWERIA